MTRGICRVTILNWTCMSQRDLSHQTPTWTRSVGGDFLWWRKMPYCTVTSMTRTKRCHRSAGGALPPMVRPRPCLKTRGCNRERLEPKALWMWRLYALEMFWRRLQLFDVCAWVGSCVILTFPVPFCSRQAQAHLNAGGIQLGGRQRRPGQAEEREQERWVGGCGREKKKGGQGKEGDREGQRELRGVGGYLIISSPSQISEPKSRRMSWPVKTDNMLDISSCLYLLHMFIIYHCSFFPFIPLSLFPSLSLPALLSLCVWI